MPLIPIVWVIRHSERAGDVVQLGVFDVRIPLVDVDHRLRRHRLGKCQHPEAREPAGISDLGLVLLIDLGDHGLTDTGAEFDDDLAGHVVRPAVRSGLPDVDVIGPESRLGQADGRQQHDNQRKVRAFHGVVLQSVSPILLSPSRSNGRALAASEPRSRRHAILDNGRSSGCLSGAPLRTPS